MSWKGGKVFYNAKGFHHGRSMKDPTAIARACSIARAKRKKRSAKKTRR